MISELQEGQPVSSFSQLLAKQIRSKRNGEPYLRLVLGDRSGKIEARMWEGIESCRDEIEPGDFVRYEGRVETYNGAPQIIVDQIRRVRPEDRQQGFSEKDLIPTTSGDIEEMWERLLRLVQERTARPPVRLLLEKILQDRAEAIRSYPAAVEIHHNYWGGFLEHVLSVLESALFFAGRYPRLDADLLIGGAILHDIGKLEELTGPLAPSYTVKGHLIGHVVLGRDILREAAAQIPGFPTGVLLLLEHMILSHQGRPEWGAPKCPQIPEALLLHYLDDLDAKLNRFFSVREKDPGDSDFTRYDRYLERVLFKGDYDGEAESPSPEHPPEEEQQEESLLPF